MKPIDFKPDPKRRKKLMKLLRQDITEKRPFIAAITCGLLRHELWLVATQSSYFRAYRLAMKYARK